MSTLPLVRIFKKRKTIGENKERKTVLVFLSVGAEGLLVTNVTREHVTNPLPFVRIFRKRKTIGENKKRKTVLVFLLWALRDSNPRPSGCKPDALNQLS